MIIPDKQKRIKALKKVIEDFETNQEISLELINKYKTELSELEKFKSSFEIKVKNELL